LVGPLQVGAGPRRDRPTNGEKATLTRSRLPPASAAAQTTFGALLRKSSRPVVGETRSCITGIQRVTAKARRDAGDYEIPSSFKNRVRRQESGLIRERSRTRHPATRRLRNASQEMENLLMAGIGQVTTRTGVVSGWAVADTVREVLSRDSPAWGLGRVTARLAFADRRRNCCRDLCRGNGARFP